MNRSGSRIFAADLDTREKIDADFMRDARSFVDAGDGVVIGQRQRAETGIFREANDITRRERAVGCGGMRVKIDVLLHGYSSKSAVLRYRSPMLGITTMIILPLFS